MLFRIAICENDKNDCRALSFQLHAVCTDLNLETQTDTFSCAEDFLIVHGSRPYEIVFMDIHLEGISGLEAAQRANRLHPCQLVFTTASREHALEAFSLNAVHYLLKPLSKDAVKEAMGRCLLRLSYTPTPYHRSSVLHVKTPRGNIPISMRNIEYIEVLNNICTIHTEQSSLQTYTTLAALFESLDNTCFIRAQRSFVVNMHFIDAFFFDHIVLKNGKEITLSRTNRRGLKKQYLQFLFDLAGKEMV